MPITSTNIGSPGFSSALLSWYRLAKRDLPWRNLQHDAYAIWISEIMLQQTTVNAVVGFYNRWIERFPSVESLADSDLDEVLRYWSGLGYYSRAKNIHKAAKMILAEHSGKLPETVGDLLLLPGVGRYTAGAISSIAYEKDAPLVDANVTRVLCRIVGIDGDAKSSSVQDELWCLAESGIPSGQARDYNQAMMELGATVCLPKSPHCMACPISKYCLAFQSGSPESYPAKQPKKQWKAATHVAIALWDGGRVLLIKRPDEGVWAGMWELPRVVLKDGEESHLEAAINAAKIVAGIDISTAKPFATVRHVVMDTKITLCGYSSIISNSHNRAPANGVWTCPEQIGEFAVSSPQRRLIALLKESMVNPTLDI